MTIQQVNKQPQQTRSLEDDFNLKSFIYYQTVQLILEAEEISIFLI